MKSLTEYINEHLNDDSENDVKEENNNSLNENNENPS